MRHKPKLTTLLAAALLPGACSPQEATNGAAVDTKDLADRPAPTAASEPNASTEQVMARGRIVISSEWGEVSAELVDNAATKALVGMLPLTLQMRDHLRQEKTGALRSPLPEVQRQTAFSSGMLGLWGNDDFVIYYREGRVPSPGIIVLGQVTGSTSIFDRPGSVTVRLEAPD